MDTGKVSDQVTVLMVPPWENAGEDHWMTLWQNRDPRSARVEQKNWDHPVLSEWSETLVSSVQRQDRPVVLVAHSLGAVTLVHAAENIASRVVAALLVAPADVEDPGTPPEIRGFAPLPLTRISFPTVLVASDNDVYASLERSRYLAGCWGSEFVNIGSAGHINPKAGFGEWEAGERLLSELISKSTSLTNSVA